jgi:hypothetical protein
MPSPSCCDRLTLRVVLLKVSPLVARPISVPGDLSLEELHDVLQLVFGWSGRSTTCDLRPLGGLVDVQVRSAEEVRAVISQARHRDF